MRVEAGAAGAGIVARVCGGGDKSVAGRVAWSGRDLGAGVCGHEKRKPGGVPACGGLLGRGCGWRRAGLGGNSSAGVWRR